MRACVLLLGAVILTQPSAAAEKFSALEFVQDAMFAPSAISCLNDEVEGASCFAIQCKSPSTYQIMLFGEWSDSLTLRTGSWSKTYPIQEYRALMEFSGYPIRAAPMEARDLNEIKRAKELSLVTRDFRTRIPLTQAAQVITQLERVCQATDQK